VVTFFAAIVRLVHNLKIGTNNGHIPKNVLQEWNHFYSMTHSSCGISMEKIAAKDGSKNAQWVHYCTQNAMATKVDTFPLHGYIW